MRQLTSREPSRCSGRSTSKRRKKAPPGAPRATAFEAVVGAVSTALKAGESVKIPGLGSFGVAERGARKGRNPATGESITIKASKTVRFKAGKDLKEAVNTKKRGRK